MKREGDCSNDVMNIPISSVKRLFKNSLLTRDGVRKIHKGMLLTSLGLIASL